MATQSPDAVVPPFLLLAGHPLRWRMLRELAASDRQVAELTQAVRAPQGLVSYHLGKLRSGGLVSAHKSSFDGRAMYYRVHLDRCRDALVGAGATLHPSLGAWTAPPTTGASQATVLFVCTGNGARSQIAEALLRAKTGGVMDVASAGSHPKPIHPNAIAVLAERGIDISGARSKHLDEFVGRGFDHVVTLCDRVREICPDFAGTRAAVHWSIEDPSRPQGARRATMPAFRAIAADLDARLDFFLSTIHTTPPDSTSKEQTHAR